MSSLIDEIEHALRSLRQQHEIETSQCERLEQYMEAHSADLIERIRKIREREACRRADVARELVLLAAEVGLLPPPSPDPIPVGAKPSIRMPNCIARHASDDLAQSIN